MMYGIPYQGSKSRIAKEIIDILPKGKRLVDLFGGGGAITHCALLSGKWDEVLYNDINPLPIQLFTDAVNGKLKSEHRVITREMFNELKDSDPYVKYCWSFGNKGESYLWGKDIEEIKVTACHMLINEDLHDRYMAYKKFVKLICQIGKSRIDLQSLQSLERLERLETSNIDYHDYIFREGDVVYCDIPYEKKKKGKCSDYGLHFDNLEFYKWAKSREYQVFFSSYEISDASFYKVPVKEINQIMGANTNGQKVTEYLYSNRPIEQNEQISFLN